MLTVIYRAAEYIQGPELYHLKSTWNNGGIYLMLIGVGNYLYFHFY